uniref:Enkurin domain-containing protein n=1 Tax=Oncorhynchus mykiss TaxID=8022 RepID=A0A8K9WUM8_ONCMY
MSTTMYPTESIYNLIPREEVKIEKPPRYMSKFRAQVKHEKMLNKPTNKTMGQVKVDLPSPEKYLLKHSKEPKLPENFQKTTNTCQSRQPTMGIHTKKDFVKTNAFENIMAVPKKPQPIYADTKTGDKQLLENSGLLPKYIKKKDFGKTPEYLQHRTEEVRRAQDEYDSFVKEHMRQGTMKQLSEDERNNILQGLKMNWGELHHQYQGLSVVTDTTPKKYRKERLELEMKQLERDIDLIERYKTIFIANKLTHDTSFL